MNHLDILNNGSSKRVAFITGINGQDGSYLAELLLEKGYEVHGLIRPRSLPNTTRISHLLDLSRSASKRPSITLHYGDLLDRSSLTAIISQIKPTEIYNLAAQPHVKVSFEMAEYTTNVTGIGVQRLLESINTCHLVSTTRLFQASTSELFGKHQDLLLTELSPFAPISPYADAKLFAHRAVVNFREAYNMFAVNGILFNHEGPRRGETFVSRKITRSVAKIYYGQLDYFEIGNLDAKRDWGHARDYVECMWLMLQQEEPKDYLCLGEIHSVREFVEEAFAHAGIRIRWKGSGVDEIGYDERSGLTRVKVQEKYFRPSDIDVMEGDPSLASTRLGWRAKVKFHSLVKEMVEADLRLLAAK